MYRIPVWAKVFHTHTHIQTGPGAAQSPVQCVPSLFPGGKADRSGDHIPLQAQRLKKKIYYSTQPMEFPWSVIG